MNNPNDNFSNLELFNLYYCNHSIALRNRLVQLNLGLVRKVAYQMSRTCGEQYEDLEQIAIFGLIRAVERFNPQRGVAFSSFAMPYIRGEILHYLRDQGSLIRIPRVWQELYTKGQKLRQKLRVEWGRSPSDQELAQSLNVALEEWQACRLAWKNRSLMSLDAKLNNTDVDETLTLGDTLPDPNVTKQRQRQEIQLQLQGMLAQLEERTKTAIELVCLEELSRQEVAKRIGINSMTVSRHLQKGIDQLNRMFQPQVA